MIFAITTYYSGNRIKKNMLGRARDTNCRAGGGGVHTGFWCGNLKERVLDDLYADGRRI